MHNLSAADIHGHVIDASSASVEDQTPGRRLLVDTATPSEACALDVLLMLYPNLAMICCVNPEQSIPFVRLLPP